MTQKLIQFTLLMKSGRIGEVRVTPELAGETWELIMADDEVAEVDTAEIEVQA